MKEKIVELIKHAGVVGAGGAGFPTHVKVNAAAEYVIVNGAECEPLLRVDQQLMAVMAEKMVKGLEAVMEATGASKGIIALKGKYHDAVDALEKVIIGKPMELFILGNFYPAGDEQVTVYEVLKRIVPEGSIPLNVSCVVNNVESLINVANALEEKPVTDTYITVTGDVPNHLTVKVPIGMSVAETIALAGLKDLEGKEVVDGGPMMGKLIEDFGQPVTKITKGLIVLPKDHVLVRRKTMSLAHIIKQAKSCCIQCQRCTDVCPRHLLGHRLSPHKIMRGINYFNGDEEVMKQAVICSECGACEYACPMGLSPRMVNVALKKEFSKNKVRPDVPDKPPEVARLREYTKIPVNRLIIRLGLKKYDVSAPLSENNYLPKSVVISLRQHIGAPGVPVVEVGQLVQKGDLIAAIPEGAMGANIHASISGTVKAIAQGIVIEQETDGGVK